MQEAGIGVSFWLLFGPKPMPYLLLQIGVFGGWIAFIFSRYRKNGRRGLWWVLSAPLMIVIEGLAIWTAAYLACRFGIDACP